MEPARDLVLGPAQVPVAPGPHLQHRGVIIGADLAPGPRAQRRDRHRQGIVRVVLIAGPGGQQPHPGTQPRLNAGHPLAGRDQLLGQQVTQPAGALDRPGPPRPRGRPRHQPLHLAGRSADPQRAEWLLLRVDRHRGVRPPCAGPRRSSLPSSARSKSSIPGYRTAAGLWRAGSPRVRSCKISRARRAGFIPPASAAVSFVVSFAEFAGSRGSPPVTVIPGHGRPRPVLNAEAHTWKACWGQPLASSNLASSATCDQAIRQADHAFRLGRQGCVVSFVVSFIYAYPYKSPQNYLYGHIAGAGARFWVLLRLWPPTGHHDG